MATWLGPGRQSELTAAEGQVAAQRQACEGWGEELSGSQGSGREDGKEALPTRGG